jgi:hypothetical protein
VAGPDLFSGLGAQDANRQAILSPKITEQNGETADLGDKVMRDISNAGTGVATWKAQAEEDTRYYNGDQWDDLDRMRMEQLKRPALVFNEVGDKIDIISGVERLNRTDIRFVSTNTNADLIHDAEGDLATDGCSAILDNCEGEKENSRTFKDTAIVGMGWGEVATRYDEDPDGEVIVEYRDWAEMAWDQKAKKENLEDSRWRARIRDFPRSEFTQRWPDKIDMLDQALPQYPEDNVTKYELVTPYYSTANERVNPQLQAQMPQKKSIRVIQYQHRKHVPIWRIADPQNPEGLQTLTKEQWEGMEKKAAIVGAPMPTAVRQLTIVHEQVYVAEGIVLEDPVELPRGFSLLCCTGQYDKRKKVWYGIVRGLRDPQNTMNKAISSLVTQFISNVKGGVMFKQGTFQDPTNAKSQWTQPDAWIELSAGANPATDIVQRTPSQMSQAPQVLFQESKAAVGRMSGVNEEMLGFASTEAGGPTVNKRIQAALAILGWFFDNIERYRKTQARTLLEFIREFWSYGQLIRVGGDGLNSKAIPLLKSQLPLKYTLTVDQSVRYNPNLKQQIWSDLMQIAGPLMKSPIGQQFLLKALKFSPLPAQLIAELQELAQQAAQQPPKQGRGGGKQPDPPELVQARTLKLNADAQKAIAEARNLDKRSGIEMAKMVADTTVRSHELRQKQAVAERQASLQAKRQALLMAGNGNTESAQAPPIA